MWKGRTIRKIVAVVLAVLMTGMLLTACTENKNGQQDAADAEDYIKVGIVIPQTGVLTAFGAGTEEVNAVCTGSRSMKRVVWKWNGQ